MHAQAEAMRETPWNRPLAAESIGPEYSRSFRCIGPACEDTCCSGWNVFFDEAACKKYEAVPAGPLRILIDSSVALCPPNADGSPPPHYAQVKMNTDRNCPFLNAEKLCQIQASYGEELLSSACATYPRIVREDDGDGQKEMALSLSCPEAARLVLLTPHLLLHDPNRLRSISPKTAFGEREEEPSEPDSQQRRPVSVLTHFEEIRGMVLKLLTKRDYALWERMFLLSVLTGRLEVLALRGLSRGFYSVQQGFEAAVDSGAFRPIVQRIPIDLSVQLDLVMQLAGLRLSRTHVEQRYIDTLNKFTKGIGNGPDATLQSLTQGYADAYDRYFEPFFRARPYILENLLINYVFRSLFPFGRVAGKPNTNPDMAREFALMAMQFALIKGLLIGVAGFHGEAFSESHVVETVQSVAKHFEHHPAFLDGAHALLVSCGLEDVRSIATLVRDRGVAEIELPAEPKGRVSAKEIPYYGINTGL